MEFAVIEDEELPQPDDHVAHRWRVRLGGALALIVLAGLLIGTRLWSDSRRPPLANPSVSRVVPAPVHTGNAACPHRYECVIEPDLSVSARQAVDDVFPGAVIISATTIKLHVNAYGTWVSHLDVKARSGARTITLTLDGRTGKPRDHEVATVRGATAVINYERQFPTYWVSVQVVSPSAQPVAPALLRALAADVRLIAIT